MPGQSAFSVMQLAGVVVVVPVPPSVEIDATVIDEQAGIAANEAFSAATASVTHFEYSSTVAVAVQVDVSPTEQVVVVPPSDEDELHDVTASEQAVWRSMSVADELNAKMSAAAVTPAILQASAFEMLRLR
jgi:hypothetical protein